MTTYQVIPMTQANDTEKAFISWVSDTAERLVSVDRTGEVSLALLAPAFDGVLLFGLRPDWLNTMSELSQLCARMDYGKVSQFATRCQEYEASLYGYALALVEIYNEQALAN